MPATVKLKDIVEALDMLFDEYTSYLDLETGEVETVPKDLLGHADEIENEEEEGDFDLSEWQEDEWKLAKRIAFHHDKYERLPDKFDIHEWEIMREFAVSVTEPSISGELRNAIHGKGAFRMFKSTLGRHNMVKEWYAFREKALEEIARDWCEEHGIPCK